MTIFLEYLISTIPNTFVPITNRSIFNSNGSLKKHPYQETQTTPRRNFSLAKRKQRTEKNIFFAS